LSFHFNLNNHRFVFGSLKVLLAKASPIRSGDQLAGIAATSLTENIAAKMILADTPLKTFVQEEIISYEKDEVTRLIMDQHHQEKFSAISHFTVGDLREFLLEEETNGLKISQIRDGLTAEMVSAVSKIMTNKELILVASKMRVITKFRNTIGLPGHFSTRLQPNHPTDDAQGIGAVILEGLLYGIGDAVIGINPASDNPESVEKLLRLLDKIRLKFEMPVQSCILTHITTIIELIKRRAPVDLVFQSIGGTEETNKSFGVSISLLEEAYQAALELKRGIIGENLMYFETGQGSALSASANHEVDQQTCEVRAYAVAKKFKPLLINSVVGFIGPEYLYDGKQIIRAGLEDHFCGKLMGLPMGVDICYTNHAHTDQDDMDVLLTLLGNAGCNYIMGVPGADDIMLNYQSTSFHDALYIRELLKLKPAPEFDQWLQKMNIMDQQLRLKEQPQNLLLRWDYE